MDNIKLAGDIIISYIDDSNAVIESSKIVVNKWGTFVRVYYTISEGYQKKHDLFNNKRVLDICLQKKETFQGSLISSYAYTPGPLDLLTGESLIEKVCVNNTDYENCLTLGKTYTVLEEKVNGGFVMQKVVDDEGVLLQTMLTRFE